MEKKIRYSLLLRAFAFCCLYAASTILLSAVPLQAARKKDSRLKRLETAVVKTYKTLSDGSELKVYIFNPKGLKGEDKRPAIVFFSGGGFKNQSPAQFAEHSKHLAEMGMVAICGDYRTKTSHNATAFESIKDAKSCMRWVRKNAGNLGIDVNRIAAGGGSAGGCLAAATATLKDYDEDKDQSVSCIPNALVLFNPVIDFGPGTKAFERLKDEYKKCSPIHNLRKGFPPAIFMVGTKDRLISVTTAERFKVLVEKVGGRCDLKLYEGQEHSFFNRKEMHIKTVSDMDAFLVSIGYINARQDTGDLGGVEYHVSVNGDDSNPGTKSKPFRTISAVAKVAQPGDVITVHEGVYRERINPLRGGTSDDKRIVYRAAKGEKVVIKGSEIVKGWQKVENYTWKVVLPNSFFGDFNPFDDLIRGDWFISNGRKHHTGAVYINGHWLTEAAKQDDVLKLAGKDMLWFSSVDGTNTTI